MANLSFLTPYAKGTKCNLQQLETILTSEIKRLTKGKEHYLKLLERLPAPIETTCTYDQPTVTIGQTDLLSPEDQQLLHNTLTELIPWRKGPFSLMGIEIDAEWRSDQKWERIASGLGDLSGKRVLDIGCGNGYYMYRMLPLNPELVLGIDPVWHCHAQFKLLNHFAPTNQLHHQLLGIDHLQYMPEMFDTILSMGIIYHHRHPIQQLEDISNTLRPKGELILESIGIPGGGPYALFPDDRYAKMRNVWFIPTASCMANWLHKAKFTDIEITSDTLLTPKEQRLTAWCPPPYLSLSDFLDSNDQSKTVEGYPAPRRFAIKAKKKDS